MNETHMRKRGSTKWCSEPWPTPIPTPLSTPTLGATEARASGLSPSPQSAVLGGDGICQ